MKIATPPEKSQSPLEVEALYRPPFLKIWLEVQPLPPPSRRGGVHYGAGPCPIRYEVISLSFFKKTKSTPYEIAFSLFLKQSLKTQRSRHNKYAR